MVRAAVAVRVARPADAGDLVDVWVEANGDDNSPLKPDLSDPDALLAAHREAAAAISRIDEDPDELLLLAETDGKVVGAVHLRRAPISPIQLAQAVHISHLHVRPGHRRRGIASALLSAATSWAEDTNSAHILATTPARSRDAHRFLARLGFCQVAVLRGVSVGSLRSRLAGGASAVLAPAAEALRPGGTGRLIAARRRLRRRANRGAIAG